MLWNNIRIVYYFLTLFKIKIRYEFLIYYIFFCYMKSFFLWNDEVIYKYISKHFQVCALAINVTPPVDWAVLGNSSPQFLPENIRLNRFRAIHSYGSWKFVCLFVLFVLFKQLSAMRTSVCLVHRIGGCVSFYSYCILLRNGCIIFCCCKREY